MFAETAGSAETTTGAGATTFHAFLGCSLDGFIAGPHGELDWLLAFDERLGDAGYEDFFASIDVLAMGRASYDTMRNSDPEFYRGKPIHVLSTTMPAGPQPAMGRSSVTVHPDIASLREALATAGVRRAYVDGGRTVQAFIAEGLLADIIITRVPVLIGDGIPLFGAVPAAVYPTLVDSRQINAGAVQSTYRFG
ncbi:dihydrofolate reductase family protein [Microbacterium jejuense]|uniref:Dihydrofolate reductase family protein n=1 Tax=Microbacterium jejuense TaxID=1263637 RepID=A0ABS7HK33_9MICO|nr:dihydrofolate reductase family protein [Microbacterium jejuense]MBW9092577.1 dihydrofolate reductase family protein [Microbacterium jejuense]